MERLTAYNSESHKNVAYYPVCFEYPCNGFGCKIDGCKLDYEICQRLAAYEDTGLEPGEIYEVRFLIAAQRDPQKLARLRELVLADQNGQLVVLPCKIGDTVYVIGESCDFCETYLDEPERCMRCEKGHYVEERGFELWMLSELNESIFLTREEAEAALAGKGGDV